MGTATARAVSEASSPVESTMATPTESVLALRLDLDSARTLRVVLTPLLSSVATFRRHSLLEFSSTGQTLPLESNPPFLDRVGPTSTCSTSSAVDQVFLFIKAKSYLSTQPTDQVGIYDNKQKFETF